MFNSTNFRKEQFLKLLGLVLIAIVILTVGVIFRPTASAERNASSPIDEQELLSIAETLPEDTIILHSNAETIDSISHPLAKLPEENKESYLEKWSASFDSAHSATYLMPKTGGVVTYFQYQYQTPNDVDRIATRLIEDLNDTNASLISEKGEQRLFYIKGDEGDDIFWLIQNRGEKLDLILVNGFGKKALLTVAEDIAHFQRDRR